MSEQLPGPTNNHDANGEPITPQFRRGLAVAWIVLVLSVGACIFLGMWWNVSGVRQVEFSTATAFGQVSQTPPEQAARLTQAAVSAQATATPAAPTEFTGSPAAPTPTPLPVSNVSFGYGVEVNGLDRTAETLDRVQQLGMGWVKQPVRWADIEPEPGQINWEPLDTFFAAASARGLKVLVTVYAAPDWSRSVTAENRDGPPDNVAAYTAFLTQLLQRYQGAVHAVEVWNEMNRDREWYVAGGISSASYMQLLTPAAEAIRAVDPGIIVVSGGLNPTGIDDGILAIDDFRYLRELIDMGVLDVVDCVGVHHKGYNLPPTVPYDTDEQNPDVSFQQPYDNPHHSWSFFSTLRGYHDMIIAAGRSTPLCVTEFGWASADGLPDAEGLPEFVYDNTAQDQAEYIVQAFDLMQNWDFVWFAVVANLNLSLDEEDPTSEDLAAYYRLVLPDGQPRAAFTALQDMPHNPE